MLYTQLTQIFYEYPSYLKIVGNGLVEADQEERNHVELDRVEVDLMKALVEATG